MSQLRTGVATATAALALLTTGLATQEAIGAASPDGQRHPASTPLGGDEAYERDRAGIVGQGPGVPLSGRGQVVGPGGVIFDAAAPVVLGADGRVFFGEEFDAACGYGRHLRDGLDQLARLARVIQRSGRHVLFTVAPNKSAVNSAELPKELPHGKCDAHGIERQNRVLDAYDDRNYVQVRRSLERQATRGANVYWRLDTHWTTVAAAEYAEALAEQLNPRIADLQSYRTVRETIPVDLAGMGLIDQPEETGKARAVTTDVKVRPADGSEPYDPDAVVATDLAWRTGPAQRTWRGTTLMIGDSFSYRGLSVLMPLFRHGRFLWIGILDKQILQAIPKADTVVIEIVQRYVGVSVLTQTAFRKAVKLALKAHDRRR